MTDKATTMLELRDVKARYGVIEALKGVSLRVDRGEVVSILGANGAGKSTVLRAISGLEPVAGGAIRLDGEDLATERRRPAAHKITAMGVSHCPEGRRIFPDCTVMENLEMGGYTLDSREALEKNIERAFKYFPRLEERSRQMGATLSGGEQQMLGVARALMANPRLLLLDEPSLGLAPIVVAQIFEIVQKINADGVTILIVEQNAREALLRSNRAYVLETGSIILSGDSGDLLEDPRVIEAYLGL